MIVADGHNFKFLPGKNNFRLLTTVLFIVVRGFANVFRKDLGFGDCYQQWKILLATIATAIHWNIGYFPHSRGDGATWKTSFPSWSSAANAKLTFIYTELTERHRLELHVNQSYVVCVFCVVCFLPNAHVRFKQDFNSIHAFSPIAPFFLCVFILFYLFNIFCQAIMRL